MNDNAECAISYHAMLEEQRALLEMKPLQFTPRSICDYIRFPFIVLADALVRRLAIKINSTPLNDFIDDYNEARATNCTIENVSKYLILL